MGNKNTLNKESISWFEEKKPILKLLGLFFLGMVVYLIITNLPFFKNNIYPYITSANAYISSLVLKVLGYGTYSNGDQLMSETTSLSIKKGCDALAPIAIFTSVLLAYPASFKPKLKAVIYGILLLLFVNVIRIISLYMFKIHATELFDLMHLVVWPAIFIFLAVLLCFYWIKTFETKENPND